MTKEGRKELTAADLNRMAQSLDESWRAYSRVIERKTASDRSSQQVNSQPRIK